MLCSGSVPALPCAYEDTRVTAFVEELVRQGKDADSQTTDELCETHTRSPPKEEMLSADKPIALCPDFVADGDVQPESGAPSPVTTDAVPTPRLA